MTLGTFIRLPSPIGNLIKTIGGNGGVHALDKARRVASCAVAGGVHARVAMADDDAMQLSKMSKPSSLAATVVSTIDGVSGGDGSNPPCSVSEAAINHGSIGVLVAGSSDRVQVPLHRRPLALIGVRGRMPRPKPPFCHTAY